MASRFEERGRWHKPRRRPQGTVSEDSNKDDHERTMVQLIRPGTRGQDLARGSSECNVHPFRGPVHEPLTYPSQSASRVYTPATRTKIDWRFEICHFLKLDENALDNEIIDELRKASIKMEEAERVKQQSAPYQGPLRCQIVHHVFCATNKKTELYMKEPWTVHTGPSRYHLRGSQQVSNIQLYLERNKDVSFLVHREYTCCVERNERMNQSRPERDRDTRLASMLDGEHIEVVSADLQSQLASLSDVFQGIPHPEFEADETGEDEDDDSDSFEDEFEYRGDKGKGNVEVSYPYLWFYHRRLDISEATDHLEKINRDHLDVFCGYIRTRMSDEWAAVDKLISKGEITTQYIGYVYVSLPTKLFILVSYRHRFQERLSSRRPKAVLQPNYRLGWLRTG